MKDRKKRDALLEQMSPAARELCKDLDVMLDKASHYERSVMVAALALSLLDGSVESGVRTDVIERALKMVGLAGKMSVMELLVEGMGLQPQGAKAIYGELEQCHESARRQLANIVEALLGKEVVQQRAEQAGDQ